MSNVTFDYTEFANRHSNPSVYSEKVIPNPEKKVHKLLTKILDIYMKVFDPKVFCEETKKIKKGGNDGMILATLKREMLELRQDEQKKLSSCHLSF